MQVKIKNINEFDDEMISKWCQLFKQCFGDDKKPLKMWEDKYRKNDGYIAFIEARNKIVASYSVLQDSHGRNIGLSVDTMSDGSVRHATSLICKKFYPFLAKHNLDLLIGFPNENITQIRVKHLGWNKGGTLYFKLYFFLTKQSDELSSFSINRRLNTFYSNTILHRAIELLFRTKLLGLEASLVAHGGGINIASKDWYYKVLSSNCKILIKELRYDSIDVP